MTLRAFVSILSVIQNGIVVVTDHRDQREKKMSSQNPIKNGTFLFRSNRKQIMGFSRVNENYKKQKINFQPSNRLHFNRYNFTVDICTTTLVGEENIFDFFTFF